MVWQVWYSVIFIQQIGADWKWYVQYPKIPGCPHNRQNESDNKCERGAVWSDT